MFHRRNTSGNYNTGTKTKNISVEEGPVERGDVCGKLKLVYIRDSDENLIEL